MADALSWPFVVAEPTENKTMEEGHDVALDGEDLGRWIKGAGTYTATQAGSIVTLIATGTLPSTNMRAELVQTQIALFPPEFALLFFVPDIQLPMTRDFERHSSFVSESPVDTLVVYDASGRHEIRVDQVGKQELAPAEAAE